MSKLLWVANVALALVTLAAYASPYVDPQTFWPVAFAGLLYPATVLAHLAFAATWALLGERRWWLSAAVVLAGWTHVRELVGLGADAPAADDLLLVTFNLKGGQGLGFAEGAETFRRGLAELTACVGTPDVLVTEETPRYAPVRAGLDGALDSIGLLYHYYADSCVLGIHSRYPLAAARTLLNANPINGITTARIGLPGGDTVRLVAAHLASNNIRIDPTAVVETAGEDGGAAYREVRGVAAKYRHFAGARLRQTRLITEAVRASADPAIVIGDLNDVPLSYVLGELRGAGLSDVFREAGTGLGVTFPGTLPGLRIDYVLAGPQLESLGAGVLDCALSDHYPVWGRVRVR